MIFFTTGLVAALAGYATAQNSAGTSCNPLKTSCPPDPALSAENTFWFNQPLDPRLWTMKTGTISHHSDGADFTVTGPNQSTLLVSNFYMFFGVMETHVKMAKGAGMVSSVILQSDDLDEIDWEWVGSEPQHVQSDFFGKGNTTTYTRGGKSPAANADMEFHNYTTYWDQTQLQWWVDGVLMRTVPYSDAQTVYGQNYPQTPCQVKISLWPAGTPASAPGTRQWAGGMVDYSQAPFTMTVKSVRVQDFHSGKQYVYQGNTGSWESIKVVGGNSTAQYAIAHPPQSLAQKWAALPVGAHIGVYCGAAAVGAIILVALGTYCVRQRSRGRLEHALDDARYNNERTEMQDYQNDWKQSEWNNQGYRPVH